MFRRKKVIGKLVIGLAIAGLVFLLHANKINALIPTDVPAPTSPSMGNTTTGTSNCLVISVGNPKGSLPPGCSTSSGSTSGRPTPPYYPTTTSGYEQAIKKEFNITMSGFDLTHYTYFWNKFWDIKNTNYDSLASGWVVQANGGHNGISYTFPHCNGSSIDTTFADYDGQELNNILLIHELGHYIDICRTNQQNHRGDLSSAIIADKPYGKDGYVTIYSWQAPNCVAGLNSDTEDYAEMLTYYLNPDSKFQSMNAGACAGHSNVDPNPYTLDINGQHEYINHFNLAKSIVGNY